MQGIDLTENTLQDLRALIFIFELKREDVFAFNVKDLLSEIFVILGAFSIVRADADGESKILDLSRHFDFKAGFDEGVHCHQGFEAKARLAMHAFTRRYTDRVKEFDQGLQVLAVITVYAGQAIGPACSLQGADRRPHNCGPTR